MQPRNKSSRSLEFAAGSFVFFLMAMLAGQYESGAFLSDRSNHADEAAHYVSAMALSDYFLSVHAGGAVRFMTDYYAHFPKVAIGHWPPFFEAFQGLIFTIFGGSFLVAIGTQTVIATACLTVTSVVAAKLFGNIAGIAAGLIVFFSPLFIWLSDLVMADVLEALLVTLAAASWAQFYRMRTWRWALLFSLSATLAILTKGTALGLGLMPLIYVIVKKDYGFLFTRKTLTAGAITGIFTVPWYVFTYHMAADGFNYAWGWDYSHVSVPFFLLGLFDTLGLIGAPLYLYGLFATAFRANGTLKSYDDVLAFGATSLAMFVFLVTTPADVDLRYLIPILPCAVIVMLYGLSQLQTYLPRRWSGQRSISIVGILLLVVSVVLPFKLIEVASLHSEIIAEEVLHSASPNPLILVSGNVGAEGAFIASMAELDKDKSHYVIRGQKALAESSWMVDKYKLRFNTPQELANWINRSGIGWLVTDYDADGKDFPHSVLVREALDAKLIDAKLVKSVSHAGGQMSLYSLPPVNTVPQISKDLSAAMLPGHLQ